MSLHGKEKIYFFINRLIDEREVTEDGKPIGLHPANDLNNHYAPMDFVQMVEKIEKEHNAARLIAMPTDQTYNKYLVELLPDFDNYVAELRKDPKYLDWIGEKPENTSPKSEPLSVNHARKNGVMTGKEKMQAVIEEINNKYQGLVTGNTVLLHSGNLEERGLQMHEQQQVLDILANDKKAIKYTSKNEYNSRADIHPRDQVDIHEVAMDEAEANDMFDRLLEQQQYQIEVLPTFAALADELLGDAELEHQKDVYLIRLFYNRVIAILDAVVSSGVVIEDDKLDFAYVRLTALIEDVLSKPTMKDWQKDAPELYETLLGHAEDIGEGWQYSRTEVLKYYAKLQKYWITQTFHDEIATELEKKQQELNDRLKLLTSDNKDFQVTASYLLDLAQRAEQLFNESDEGLRQKLLEYVLSNIELKDKKLSYILNDPFRTVVETKKKSLAAHNSNVWWIFTTKLEPILSEIAEQKTLTGALRP